MKKKSRLNTIALIWLSYLFCYGPLFSGSPEIPQDIPASISFIVVDLKYSEEKGVQICEIQRGFDSVFEGHDYLYENEGTSANLFVDELSSYHHEFWCLTSEISEPKLKEAFFANGFHCVNKKDTLIENEHFIESSSLPAADIKDITSYRGILLGNRDSEFARAIKATCPGILQMDLPFRHFQMNKADMNQLLRSDSVLSRFKPPCGVYPKNSKKGNIEDILADITSNLLVIKPLGRCSGQGVIIIPRSKLQKTLDYIFSQSVSLQINPDIAYKWWSIDRSTHFIVEEFAPSDPIEVPHLGNRPYDPTMRATLLLTYHNGKVDSRLIECHWRLPKYSLLDPVSETDKRKTYVKIPYYATTEPQIIDKVEKQLKDAMTRLYVILLTEKSFE